jgi:phosphoserine phosphatase
LKAKSAGAKKFSSAAMEFIGSVLALKPKIAVFDCDGTLWAGDAGADFFYWEIERGIIPAETVNWATARYRDYKAGLVDEETMCGEMVTINAGISEGVLRQAAEEFFSSVVEPRIFPEMVELAHRLQQAGCQLWAVSSTNVWVINAGAKRFGISPDHVLAVTVQIENGLATDRLIEVPTDDGKAFAIEKAISGTVDVCFGNTVHDAAMLELTRHAYAVNPTLELEKMARARHWRIYWPGGVKG